jgi:protein PhnA
MSISKELEKRSGAKCELCSCVDGLSEFKVEPRDDLIVVCSKCREQLEDNDKIIESHWHCLNDSMWSEVDGVKVIAYRMLSILNNQDLLDMLYLEDDILKWAKEGIKDTNTQPVRDANGNILKEGDSVTIIKDLVVKGAGFTAKQGTTVKKIQMVQDDPTHIQGRVNGTKIFILTKFLKKL